VKISDRTLHGYTIGVLVVEGLALAWGVVIYLVQGPLWS